MLAGGEVGFGTESIHGMSDAENNRRGYCLACLPRARRFSLSLTTSKRLLRRLLDCEHALFCLKNCERVHGF